MIVYDEGLSQVCEPKELTKKPSFQCIWKVEPGVQNLKIFNKETKFLMIMRGWASCAKPKDLTKKHSV